MSHPSYPGYAYPGGGRPAFPGGHPHAAAPTGPSGAAPGGMVPPGVHVRPGGARPMMAYPQQAGAPHPLGPAAYPQHMGYNGAPGQMARPGMHPGYPQQQGPGGPPSARPLIHPMYTHQAGQPPVTSPQVPGFKGDARMVRKHNAHELI
jgi:hypothetical protein